ncbi:MAG: hypothetical protein KDA65_06965 [Planctomycetaceae bacterium]|nr:hypothetical protein [Planctomycetaceae bacterium]
MKIQILDATLSTLSEFQDQIGAIGAISKRLKSYAGKKSNQFRSGLHELNEGFSNFQDSPEWYDCFESIYQKRKKFLSNQWTCSGNESIEGKILASRLILSLFAIRPATFFFYDYDLPPVDYWIAFANAMLDQNTTEEPILFSWVPTELVNEVEQALLSCDISRQYIWLDEGLESLSWEAT